MQEDQTLREAIGETAQPSASPTAVPQATVLPLWTAAPSSSLLEDTELAWPVRGDVLREYVQGSVVYLPTLEAWGTHVGLDIAGQVGDEVKAPMSGTVQRLYVDPLWGNVMEIAHPGGLVTRYMGLQTLALLQEGDPVRQGQLLSPLGDAPACEQMDGPHLHFEALRDGEPVDPRTLLAEQ